MFPGLETPVSQALQRSGRGGGRHAHLPLHTLSPAVCQEKSGGLWARRASGSDLGAQGRLPEEVPSETWKQGKGGVKVEESSRQKERQHSMATSEDPQVFGFGWSAKCRGRGQGDREGGKMRQRLG